MKKLFIGVYNPANCVTYLGIAAAVVGIAFADTPRIAMLMLLLSGICDLFDGRVARVERDDLHRYSSCRVGMAGCQSSSCADNSAV